MYQIITIVVCFIKKFIIGWANNRNLAKLTPLPDEPYRPPANPEIQTLKNRKTEIETTIEEFNTPSTFAKYSKMQRELNKIDKQIQELTAKLEEECKTSKQQWESSRALAKKQRDEERAAYVKRSWIIRIIVNVTLIRLVHGYFTHPLPFANEWPLSMFTNDQGRIKCSLLLAFGNLLFQF